MQLAGIKISNLFSFPYLADLSKAQEVTFHNDKNNNVNVLIGPNGAGKSKFIDVIKYVLRDGLRLDYALDHEKLTQKDVDTKTLIELRPVHLDRVYKHYDSSDKPSEVILRLTLTDHEYANLRFLCTHYQDINALIQEYSSLNVVFPAMNIDDIVLDESTIAFHCIFDFDKSIIDVDRTHLTDIQQFILEYLLHSELIQICIDIHNFLAKKEDWSDLYSTFALLSFERNTKGLSNSLRPHDRNGFVYEKGHYSARAGYYLCAQKIWQVLSPTSDTMDDVDVQNILTTSDFFVSLSAILQKYFNKALGVSLRDGALRFSFQDPEGRRSGLEGFSDGEQSLLIIILAIYGYDLHGGLLMIDEPEMHFHPQMQRSLSRMMEKISANIGAQFILATYSPLFINESNISHVYRFAKMKGITQVKSPDLHLSTDEASLIHLLKFENMSKIFFVNKIIMVEGETDAYFFEFYLQYLHTLPEWKDRVKDYEIININGKGSYTSWKKFLSRFGIDSCFIGDWDNIVDYGFLKQEELAYYYKQAKAYFPKAKKSLSRGSHYNKLVLTIRDLFSSKYNDLLGHINELYQERVFILQKGDVETYVPLSDKGLEPTVYFCHHDFPKWLQDKQFEPHRKELNDIISHIFG